MSLSDQELLTLAGKAIGIHGRYREGSKDTYRAIVHGEGYTQDWWCPLDDDGDALRLSVKLGLFTSLGNVLYIDTGAWLPAHRGTGYFTLLDASTLRPVKVIA